MTAMRRLRGAILRLVRRRLLSILLGAILAAPAAWVQVSGQFDAWVEGFSLIVGATGLALIWAGLSGAHPDWIEEE